MAQRANVSPPGPHQVLHGVQPATVAASFRQGLPQPGDSLLGIAHYPNGPGIAAADLGRVDVDLHHWRARRRHGVSIGHLVAGIAANVDDQVRLGHHLVGAARGVRADHAHAQRVGIEDGALAID